MADPNQTKSGDGEDRKRAASAAPPDDAIGSGRWDGFAGTTGGSFFRVPPWVDTTKAPGSTVFVHTTKWSDILSGAFVIYSPNVVWLLIALAVYFAFPYDYDVASRWDARFGRWIARRAALNASLLFAYDGFWHLALYRLGWGRRPFNPARRYRVGKVVHNAYYCALGALQWTFWEAAFVHSYSTGRLPYQPDGDSFGSLRGLARFAVWFPLVPLFREVHFYFAHRLIHVRAVYRYVHSIHHRNTDVEPFSGLCMHPIEHMYYYTSVAPALYLFATPFGFLWNGIHLILSPGASHSGYEDHWQSDQYHYLHHRYFECNYGTPTFMLDHIFGTFRERMADKSDAYMGGGEGVGTETATAHDRKATLMGWPDWDQVLFNLVFCVAAPSYMLRALLTEEVGSGAPHATLIAAAVTLGPIAGSVLLLLLTFCARKRRRRRPGGLRGELSYPFHREALAGSLGLHLAVGFVLGVLPAFHVAHMVLSPPGEGAYFMVRNALSALDWRMI